MENRFCALLKDERGHFKHFLDWKNLTSTASNMHHWAPETIKKS